MGRVTSTNSREGCLFSIAMSQNRLVHIPGFAASRPCTLWSWQVFRTLGSATIFWLKAITGRKFYFGFCAILHNRRTSVELFTHPKYFHALQGDFTKALHGSALVEMLSPQKRVGMLP